MPERKPAPLTEGRFPGYDVLSKRHTVSWNEQTREVIDRRLAIGPEPKFFTSDEFQTVVALAERIVPQPTTRPRIPVAALVDDKLFARSHDGYRRPGMPHEAEAWRRGLKALDDEAQQVFGGCFVALSDEDKDALLRRMEQGALQSLRWGDMSPSDFFKMRMARDLVYAYYAHPTAWSEIGWGGPASPRGYVRMDFNERDPWEAAEVRDGNREAARRRNSRVG